MCLDQIGESAADYEAATSSEDLKLAWEEVNAKFARVRELIGSVKGALTDLQNAEKARRRTAQISKDADKENKRTMADSLSNQLKVANSPSECKRCGPTGVGGVTRAPTSP